MFEAGVLRGGFRIGGQAQVFGQMRCQPGGVVIHADDGIQGFFLMQGSDFLARNGKIVKREDDNRAGKQFSPGLLVVGANNQLHLQPASSFHKHASPVGGGR